MKRPFVLFAFGLQLVTPLAGQQAVGEVVRLVEMRSVPESPGFAEPFELQLTVRVAAGNVLLLPDSLAPQETAESFGPATWQVAPAPGDSLDVIAVYPVIGYREGRLDLPILELRTRPADGVARVLPASETPLLAEDRSHAVPLGAVLVPELAAMADSGARLVPRPPADVLGRAWSLWLGLGVGILALAGVVGAGRAAPGWWAATGGALLIRLRQESPREKALKELDRIRSLGWHTNGRLDDFYASTTDVLRRFVQEIEPDLPTSLTSTELLRALESRPRARNTEALSRTISTAERTKFGIGHPPADVAEVDWSVVRDWISAASHS
ncbi:MAG: hypothetical protein GEU90_08935 [Gemmatimonas sp.]|nr:hypothetical protein [Gemmatimonas sp.]